MWPDGSAGSATPAIVVPSSFANPGGYQLSGGGLDTPRTTPAKPFLCIPVMPVTTPLPPLLPVPQNSTEGGSPEGGRDYAIDRPPTTPHPGGRGKGGGQVYLVTCCGPPLVCSQRCAVHGRGVFWTVRKAKMSLFNCF